MDFVKDKDEDFVLLKQTEPLTAHTAWMYHLPFCPVLWEALSEGGLL